MSDLILSKQRKKETKVAGSLVLVVKKLLKFIKPMAMVATYVVIIRASLKYNSLFLSELLVSGAIMAMLYFVHVLSQKQ
ncbi:hypothetical protein [Psychroserpens luteolus]|uniref:hypothetical protein n=1 Tax=Psychroserpens luteolus TaxID=2855840 RepID=UPI001E49D17A|nr:hypothetical protein [Psychroserpens luteolus]MCD2257664.1 hypothetical protein [Psychroserpens luteolus]